MVDRYSNAAQERRYHFSVAAVLSITEMSSRWFGGQLIEARSYLTVLGLSQGLNNMKRILLIASAAILVIAGFGFLLPARRAQSPGNTLPPAKQAIEDQYQQERAAGQLNPAPSDPDAQVPAVQAPAFKVGIIGECDASTFKAFRVLNCWQGIVDNAETVVYAGAENKTFDSEGNEIFESNPQQGLMIIDGKETHNFPAPERTGALIIVAEKNGILTLASETGRSYAFDVNAGTFKSLTSFKCPVGQGLWKNKPTSWPVFSLTLGNDIYTQAELLTILNTPIGAGSKADASMILAVQLIAAKLNIANGSDAAPILTNLQHADGLFLQFYNDKDKLPFKVNPSSTMGQAMITDATKFDSYNSGRLTPTCLP